MLKGHTFINLPVSYANAIGSGARQNNGSAWRWGDNTYGSVGDNTTTSRSSPTSVVGNHSFISIYGVGDSSVVCSGLKSDGTVWTWGFNATTGQLGDNTINNRSSPVSVVGAHSFISMDSGQTHSLALKSTGTCWAWGWNLYSQIGDNTTTLRSSPVSVVGAHSFIQVSAGSKHSIALKLDGSAWCWGEGFGGKLGDNSGTTRASPVSVVGAHSFTKVLAGENVSCGLKANGELWTWGSGTYGPIGDNTTTYRSSPVSVVGNHQFVDMINGGNGGWSVFLAIKSDGTAWCWGANSNGACGDNSANDRSSPVSVVGNFSFTKIGAGVAGGGGDLFALDGNGRMWAWGNDGSGRLGTNSVFTGNKSSPVAVIGQPYRGKGPFFSSNVQIYSIEGRMVTPI